MNGKKHHVLVVGAGSIGERHLRCFMNTDRADVSFVEINENLRRTVAERYPDATPYSSLEAAFEKEDQFDAAVIATPAPLHIEQSIWLIKKGVHLLIEKPLSLNLDRIDELRNLADSAGKIISVAYVTRANPILREMREALNTGQFGRPVELVVVTGQNFPTYRPAYREIYYRDRKMGGGAIQDALTHTINTGQWLVGNIDRVVADAAHQVLEGVEVEDTVHVLARHGDVLASYSLNQHQAPNELTITVVCDRGTLRLEMHKQRWRSMKTPDTPWEDHDEFTFERDTLFEQQACFFMDAVEGVIPPLCDLQEGIESLKVNLAILKSTETGSWQSISR